jgi:hypothetical protein
MTTPIPPMGPPRDRRSRRRLVTKRNVLSVAGVLLVVFIGLSVVNELRGPEEGTFGRLYDHRAPTTEPLVPIREQAEPLRVKEGVNDPLLSEAARREQLLGITEYVTPHPPSYGEEPTIVPTTPARPLETGLDPTERERRPSRFVISGGSNGVQVTTRPSAD